MSDQTTTMIDRLYLELSQFTRATTRREAEQAAEIAALREAVRWLDLHRGELPSGMDPDAYPAYVRALEEER